MIVTTAGLAELIPKGWHDLTLHVTPHGVGESDADLVL